MNDYKGRLLLALDELERHALEKFVSTGDTWDEAYWQGQKDMVRKCSAVIRNDGIDIEWLIKKGD